MFRAEEGGGGVSQGEPRASLAIGKGRAGRECSAALCKGRLVVVVRVWWSVGGVVVGFM